jgi:copper transport protein
VPLLDPAPVPTGRRLLWRALVALLLGTASLLGPGAVPSGAHASLVSVDPPDGARLDASPPEIRLTFNEGVSANLGGVRVLSSEGERVDDGAAEVDGTVVRIALQPDLPDGTYVVAYRIVSEDGHPIRGGSVFGVGAGDVDTGALAAVADPGADREWEIVGGVGRGLAYAGTLLAAGGALFLLFAFDGGAERRTLLRIVRVAAAVGGAAALVALPIQAALGTGEGPSSLFDDGVLREVARDGVGLAIVLGLAGLLLTAVAIGRWKVASLAGALVAAGSFAASGHTRSGSAVVATIADAGHLLAVSLWVGGLVLLAVVLIVRKGSPAEDPKATARMVLRFSTLATVGLLVAAISGTVLSWNEVRSLSNVGGTNYGTALMVKLGLVTVLAAIGGYNRFRLLPAFEQGKVNAALARLRRTVVLEVGLVVAVIATTSVLVVVTPARTAVAGGPVERIIQLDDLGEVQLVVAPAKAGFNEIHLYLFDADKRPADLADEITMELSLPEAELGPIVRLATRAGPAHLQLNGNDLAVAGDWEITLRLRVDRFTEVSGTAEVPVRR